MRSRHVWFSVTAVSSSQINVVWSASASATGYRVYQWTGSGWALVANLGATATSYVSSNLLSKTTYFYHVEACNTVGSANNGWKSATTL